MRYLSALLTRSNKSRASFDQPRARRSLAARKNAFRRRLLFLEQLEDRRVLAAISWDGGGGDLDWNNAANRSGDALPGAADDVTINVAGDVTIVHSTGSADIHSLISQESINWSGGSLAVHADSSVNGQFYNDGTVEVQSGQLRMGSGGGNGSYQGAPGTTLIFADGHTLGPASIIDAHHVTFEGAYDMTTAVAGSYRADGSTQVSGVKVNFTGSVDLGEKLNIGNFGGANFGSITQFVPTIRLVDVSRLTGAANFTTSAFLWGNATLAGSGSLDVLAGGVLELFQSDRTLDGVRLNNHGAGTWTVGALEGVNGAAFHNYGDLEVQAESFYGRAGESSFHNHASGSVRKTSGVGLSDFRSAFTNDGLVEAQAGKPG